MWTEAAGQFLRKGPVGDAAVFRRRWSLADCNKGGLRVALECPELLAVSQADDEVGGTGFFGTVGICTAAG